MHFANASLLTEGYQKDNHLIQKHHKTEHVLNMKKFKIKTGFNC